MPSTTDAPRAPSANKKRLEALVAETVKVLDRPKTTDDAPAAAIERDSVRSKLRLNRAHGMLDLASIRPDPDQPRQVDTKSEGFLDLVESVKAHGVLQPITVRHIEDGDYFQLIAGERRYRASLAAGLTEIPAIVRDVDDTTKAIEQLVENVQRENLNPVEEAAALRRLMVATGDTQDQLAARIRKSKAYVSQVLAIDDQLTRQEKANLVKVSPAKLPGKSLIYAALQAPDPKTRSAILSGNLTRVQARQVLADRKPNAGGRPRSFVRTFVDQDLDATVTVRFTKKVRVPPEDVLAALDSARTAMKRELRGS